MNLINVMHKEREKFYEKNGANEKAFREYFRKYFRGKVVGCIDNFYRTNQSPTENAYHSYALHQEWMQGVSYDDFTFVLKNIKRLDEERDSISNEKFDEMYDDIKSVTSNILLTRMAADMEKLDCEEISFSDYDFLRDLGCKSNTTRNIPKIVRENLRIYEKYKRLYGIKMGYCEAIDRMTLFINSPLEGEEFAEGCLRGEWNLPTVRGILKNKGIKEYEKVQEKDNKLFKNEYKLLRETRKKNGLILDKSKLKIELLKGSSRSYNFGYEDICRACDDNEFDPAILRSGYDLYKEFFMLEKEVEQCQSKAEELLVDPKVIENIPHENYYNSNGEWFTDFCQTMCTASKMLFINLSEAEKEQYFSFGWDSGKYSVSLVTSGIPGVPVVGEELENFQKNSERAQREIEERIKRREEMRAMKREERKREVAEKCNAPRKGFFGFGRKKYTVKSEEVAKREMQEIQNRRKRREQDKSI